MHYLARHVVPGDLCQDQHFIQTGPLMAMLGGHIDFSIFHDNYDESVIKLACLCGRRH